MKHANDVKISRKIFITMKNNIYFMMQHWMCSVLVFLVMEICMVIMHSNGAFLIKKSAIATDALLPEFNSAPGANLPLNRP